MTSQMQPGNLDHALVRRRGLAQIPVYLVTSPPEKAMNMQRLEDPANYRGS